MPALVDDANGGPGQESAQVERSEARGVSRPAAAPPSRKLSEEYGALTRCWEVLLRGGAPAEARKVLLRVA